MQLLNTILYVIQVLSAASLVGLILIQHGKGADAGAAFGSGASATVFGSRGPGSFLNKVTAFVAAIFIANSLLLGYVASHVVQQRSSSVLDRTETSRPATGIPSEVDALPVDIPAAVEEADGLDPAAGAEPAAVDAADEEANSTGPVDLPSPVP